MNTTDSDLTDSELLTEKIKEVNSNISKFGGITKLGINCTISAIATTCNGIGSKVISLYEKSDYKTIANDLAAANLNKLVCSGASAIGFNDYIATNKLDTDSVTAIIKELTNELSKYNCPLLTGKTSILDNVITHKNIDICGFVFGANPVKKQIINSGDIIIALVSNGIQTTGFSKIKKLYSENKLTEEEFNMGLAPSYNYYNAVLPLIKKGLIKSATNITTGGIIKNLSELLSDEQKLNLNLHHIPEQPLFNKLKEIYSQDEFYSTFNAGIGLCMIVDRAYPEIFEKCNEFDPFVLGTVE